jgi:hypothetical protein
VHPLAFIAIPDDFRPLRWRELGRLHGSVYCSNVGRVLALSKSYIRCDQECDSDQRCPFHSILPHIWLKRSLRHGALRRSTAHMLFASKGRIYWHRFIDHLAHRKSTENFFASLV